MRLALNTIKRHIKPLVDKIVAQKLGVLKREGSPQWQSKNNI